MKRSALILFLLSFFIYNLNLNITGSGDNTPARLLPFNFFSGRGFFFDDWAPLLIERYPDVLQKFGIHYISSYPYLPGILTIPIHLPFYLYLKVNNLTGLEDLYFYSILAEKLSASFFASLSAVAFLFLFHTIFQNKKASFIFALIFAFATQSFSISSQHLWQHTVANLFLILSLIFFIRRQFFLSIILGLLCLFSRTIFIFYLPILLAMIFLSYKKGWKIYLATFLAGLMVFAALNYYLYGLPIGTDAVSIKYFDPSRFLSNLAVLIFSPARGLLFYTPFFFFGLAAILLWKKMSRVLILNLIFLYTILLIYSVYALVDDGWVWGDRYLTDGAVPAVILSFYFLSRFKNRLLKIIFILTIIYSVFAQIIGTFYYPKARWDNYPTNISYSPQRLWDFTDNPLVRNLAVGPKLDGYYMMFYLLAGIEPKDYTDKDRSCQMEMLAEDSYLGYKRVSLKITNNSNTEWLTAGTKSVQIRAADSPIPPTFLPPLIKAHTSVIIRLVIVSPKEDSDTIIITPAQISLNLLPFKEEVFLWDKSCQLTINNI